MYKTFITNGLVTTFMPNYNISDEEILYARLSDKNIFVTKIKEMYSTIEPYAQNKNLVIHFRCIKTSSERRFKLSMDIFGRGLKIIEVQKSFMDIDKVIELYARDEEAGSSLTFGE